MRTLIVLLALMTAGLAHANQTAPVTDAQAICPQLSGSACTHAVEVWRMLLDRSATPCEAIILVEPFGETSRVTCRPHWGGYASRYVALSNYSVVGSQVWLMGFSGAPYAVE